MNLRDSKASLVLDLTRAAAAQAVCIGHTIGTFGVLPWIQPPYVPYMQNVAVLVFFLISGFVIAFTLDTRSERTDYGFRQYFIERFARIYSALVPSLIIIAALDYAFGTVRWTLSPTSFLGNLLQVQDVMVRPLQYLLVPSFGTAGQLWTLAIEFHLYLFVGAFFIAWRRGSLLLLTAAFLFATVPLGYLKKIPDVDFGHGVSILWFSGFGSYFAIKTRFVARIPSWALVALGIGSLAIYGWHITPGEEFYRTSYTGLIFAFFCMVALAVRVKAGRQGVGAAAIKLAAAYSFTLYLVHNSLVKGIAHVWIWDPIIAAVIAIAGANLLAYFVARPTEMRHREFASYLSQRLKGQRAAAVASS